MDDFQDQIAKMGGPLAFLEKAQELESNLFALAKLLKCKPFEVANRVQKLVEEVQQKTVERDRLKSLVDSHGPAEP